MSQEIKIPKPNLREETALLVERCQKLINSISELTPLLSERQLAYLSTNLKTIADVLDEAVKKYSKRSEETSTFAKVKLLSFLVYPEQYRTQFEIDDNTGEIPFSKIVFFSREVLEKAYPYIEKGVNPLELRKIIKDEDDFCSILWDCLLYTSPSPRD